MDFRARFDAVRQVREVVWGMEKAEDIRQVMEVVSAQLRVLGVPFDMLGVNVINRTTGELALQYYTVLGKQGQEEWVTRVPEKPVREPFDYFWLSEDPIYRPNLLEDDQFGELSEFISANLPVVCVVDVSFLHGTLAASSHQPHAFTAEHLNILQEVAEVLSDGFRRLDDLRTLKESEDLVAVDLGLERLRNEVLQVKSQEDWLQVVTAFAWEISVLVRCDQCIIYLIDPETKQVTKYLTGGTSVEHQEVSQLPAHLDQIMKTSTQCYRSTQEEVKRAGGWDAPEVKCAIDTPFLGGVATLSSTTEHAFGKRDLRVIAQFAQVLSASSLRLAELKRSREKEEQLHQAQRLQALGQLAAGVAHSFNDLLQGIIFNTDLCLDPALVTPHKECLEGILSCSLRGAELVRQLMLFEGYHPLAATSPIARV